MTVYIGIDPGQKGGVAVISDSGYPYAECIPMPLTADKEIDVVAIHAFLSGCYGPRYVAVEKVGAMPKQGVTSTFTFGKGYGRVLGMLEAMGYSYELVRPQVWQRAMGVVADEGQSLKKAKAIAVATRMYPELADAIRRSDGQADALLIATWRKRYGG